MHGDRTHRLPSDSSQLTNASRARGPHQRRRTYRPSQPCCAGIRAVATAGDRRFSGTGSQDKTKLGEFARFPTLDVLPGGPVETFQISTHLGLAPMPCFS